MNTYLIFLHDIDISFDAANLEDLKKKLVDEELMNEMEEISDFNWTIYENGTLIQG